MFGAPYDTPFRKASYELRPYYEQKEIVKWLECKIRVVITNSGNEIVIPFGNLPGRTVRVINYCKSPSSLCGGGTAWYQT